MPKIFIRVLNSFRCIQDFAAQSDIREQSTHDDTSCFMRDVVYHPDLYRDTASQQRDRRSGGDSDVYFMASVYGETASSLARDRRYTRPETVG